MRFVFRTDVSAKMGSGHVMRCLTLAEALRENGVFVIFVSRKHTGTLNHLISKRGFHLVVLDQPKMGKSNKSKSRENGDNYKEFLGVSEMQDAEDTIHALNNNKPEWLIVDHYALGEKWENKLRPYVKNMMVLDDLANRRHDCDLLLDQNWFENMETRYEDLVTANCTKLLGPEYTLLRPEFSITRKSLKQRNGIVDRIFVYFGGSDPYNLTKMTIQALSEPELTYLEVDLVIGGNNTHQDEIQKMAELRELTHLHIQVDDMASIMAKADLAIGSGGTNTWERMCLGIPTLTISFADNHTIMLQDLVKHGYVNSLGNVAEVDEVLIKKEIIDKINAPLLLSDQTNKTFNLVNGNGSQILTDWLIGDLSNKNWEVKNATNEAMELYWVWANDEQVRKNAINKKPIPWTNHVRWFNKKLEDEKCSMYLIMVDNYPIGQVRFEDEEDFARIDYSIAKQFRGRKIGKKVLNEAISEYRKKNKKQIYGEVLSDNIASAKTFASLGFSMNTKQNLNTFTKEYSVLDD